MVKSVELAYKLASDKVFEDAFEFYVEDNAVFEIDGTLEYSAMGYAHEMVSDWCYENPIKQWASEQ